MKKYEDLTDYQKQEICNGCGGKGGMVTPPHAIFFKTSCNHHDYGYWKGSTWKDRRKCDQNLKCAMTLDCKKLKWYNWLRYYPWCLLYYFGVRIIGWKFFYYGEKQRDPDVDL